MHLRVITAPAPLLAAYEAKVWAPVLGDDTDERVDFLLSVAQAAIEPPMGWTGRAFGVQTLEAEFRGYQPPCLFLPAPPLREVLSVSYQIADGEVKIIPLEDIRVLGVGTTTGSISMRGAEWWPGSYGACTGPYLGRHERFIVRFTAGYDDADPVLNPVRQAIVLGAVQLRSLGTQDLAIRSEDVAGVGSTTWTVSDAAAKLVQGTVEQLLSPFRVYV